MRVQVATPTAPAETQLGVAPEPAFRRIVCGIDGSRGARQAAHQAAALAGAGSSLELLAVADEWGVGMNAGAILTKAHAKRALAEIAHELRVHGMRPATRVVCGRPAYEVLLAESADADLLVVGRHSHSRLGGVAIGRTATNLLHRAHIPLLVSVPVPEHRPFPGRILVAADGPGNPERAVRLAGLIARDSGSDITLARLSWSRFSKRPQLASAIAELEELGVAAVEVLTSGLPRRQIPVLAKQEKASLVIVGSRGLTGPRALGSTSERVAHEAPCSVLVVRPPAAES